jgi:hypothetical protein
MGISTRQVTVTTSPTALVDATAEAEMVYLHSSSGHLLLGNSDVTQVQPDTEWTTVTNSQLKTRQTAFGRLQVQAP